MNLSLDRVLSPIGTILLVWERDVLRALDFLDYEDRLHRLLQCHYGAYQLAATRAPAALRDPLDAYFQGELTALDQVPVQTNGTAFQQQVWTALRTVPVGHTTTYGELAKQIGRPGACRAVGLANGSNPIGIVLPCHRVVGANGALTGYAGGLDRKRWLLAHEQGGVFRVE